MNFTESNTVEQMILDAVGKVTGAQPSVVRETPPSGWGDSLGGEFKPSHWDYIPAAKIPRQTGDVMVEAWVREALIKLNPEIAAQPDRADEVIYNLRACILSVQADGLVRANENFMAWMRGEKTMPSRDFVRTVSIITNYCNYAVFMLLITTYCNKVCYRYG